MLVSKVPKGSVMRGAGREVGSFFMLLLTHAGYPGVGEEWRTEWPLAAWAFMTDGFGCGAAAVVVVG